MAYGGEWCWCDKEDNAHEKYVSSVSDKVICWQLVDDKNYWPLEEKHFEYALVSGERKSQEDMLDTDVRLIVQEWDVKDKYSPMDIWKIELTPAEKLTNIITGVRND